MRHKIVVLGLAVAPLVACEGGKTTSELGPFRGGWETVVETDFPYLDDMDMPQITSVTIGGSGGNENFENRGDVIVLWDGAPGTIKVEMRKFAWSETESEAEDAYEKLQLWAYNTSIDSPKPPGDMDDANNCAVKDGTWLDGCGVRVYYEGQIEPARYGADLRVTIPSDYRHTVNVKTSDNDFSEDYINRGNVCVEGLNGTLDVDMQQGVAFVILDGDVTPGPTCSADQITACEEWADGAWGLGCGCENFGRAHVVAANSAADITFDVPDALWASMNLDTVGECEATVNWAGTEIEGEQPLRGENNHPSDVAPAGGGFNIRGATEDCAPVRFTEDPDDFVGENKSDEQASETRGNVEVCAGCLRDSDCDKLLPGT